MVSPKASLSPLHCPGASRKGGLVATASTAPVAQPVASPGHHSARPQQSHSASVVSLLTLKPNDCVPNTSHHIPSENRGQRCRDGHSSPCFAVQGAASKKVPGTEVSDLAMLLESAGRAAAALKKSGVPKPAPESFLDGQSIVCHRPARHNGAQGRTAAPAARPSAHLCTQKRGAAVPAGLGSG